MSSDPENEQTSALLEKALVQFRIDSESDKSGSLIAELRKRGDVETFEAARKWCNSQDGIEREFAADLLSQLGYPNKKEEDGKTVYPFADQTIPLLNRLVDDSEARVVGAATFALGHHEFYDLITDRPSLLTHLSADVRYAVAYALCGAKSEIAIEFLIRLSDDEDDDVRDWATFGLGTQCDVDTPKIREALFRRLADNHFNTRSEGLVGLAVRHDNRVVSFIKADLEAESVGMLAVEAAGEIASADLIEPLEELIDWWDVDTKLLNAALKRCKGESDPEDKWMWDSPTNRD